MSLWRRIKWFWREMQEHPDKPETWLGFCALCMCAQPSDAPSWCGKCRWNLSDAVRRPTGEGG